MSNTMFLVCTHHPDRVHSLRLALRNAIADGYHRVPLSARIESFLETHKHCGGGCDHFTLAFELPKDHDLPKIEPVANGVYVALTDAATGRPDARTIGAALAVTTAAQLGLSATLAQGAEIAKEAAEKSEFEARQLLR